MAFAPNLRDLFILNFPTAYEPFVRANFILVFVTTSVSSVASVSILHQLGVTKPIELAVVFAKDQDSALPVSLQPLQYALRKPVRLVLSELISPLLWSLGGALCALGVSQLSNLRIT
jgi:hypothetical protein